MGCAAAHFKAQAWALGDRWPLALVLEDDTIVSEDIVVRLWALVREELPCDWEVLSLLSRCPFGECISQHLSRVWPDGNEPTSLCRAGVNLGLHAVLYRASALPQLLEQWRHAVFNGGGGGGPSGKEEGTGCWNADAALASISDRVGYYAVPAVQEPGFAWEASFASSRLDINTAGQSGNAGSFL
jgi:hypothetical protein